MKSIIFATFDAADKVDRAFVQMLQLGADSQDLIVVTRGSYDDPALRIEVEGSDVSEHMPEFRHRNPRGDLAVDISSDEVPPLRIPFADTPGGFAILDRLRLEGDLSESLVDLGFAKQMGDDLEKAVIGGGALLIVRAPSGPIDQEQAWALIDQCGGTGISQMMNRPYFS